MRSPCILSLLYKVRIQTALYFILVDSTTTCKEHWIYIQLTYEIEAGYKIKSSKNEVVKKRILVSFAKQQVLSNI